MSENTLSKKDFNTLSDELNEALLEAQFDLNRDGKGPLLVIISGNDMAGKAEVIYRFYEWLDNRYLNTRAYHLPEGIDKRMPRMWRYWRTLPPSGEIGFYLGSWYHQPLMDYSRGTLSFAEFEQQMQDILRFEQMLVNEGVVLVKLWLQLSNDNVRLQLSKSEVKKALDSVSMREWGDFSAQDYEKVREASHAMIQLSSSPGAEWQRVPSQDPYYRDIQIGRLILDALRNQPQPAESLPLPRSWIPSNEDLLGQLDYSARLEKDDYKTQLDKYQKQLKSLVTHPDFAKLSLLLVFEGSDAAGKGGAIRRVSQCLDPRQMRVHGTRAPTEEERLQPYLMRFWKRIPAPGKIVIFDRSYYGRVLVERVEGFCTTADWQRAYGEINDFERQLLEADTVIIKFWLAIDQDEQLARFKERDASPLKRYKLTDEDWRNRDKWPAYHDAANDMLSFTNSKLAPWNLIAANDKRHARIQVLKAICEHLRQRLK